MPKKKATPEEVKTEDTAVEKPKVRIKIRAYDHKIIDQSTKTIIETAERTDSFTNGKEQIYCP